LILGLGVAAVGLLLKERGRTIEVPGAQSQFHP
jgi:hypothetical protein